MENLTRNQVLNLNTAFDTFRSLSHPTDEPVTKRRKLSSEVGEGGFIKDEVQEGGFIREDDGPDYGGGFVAEGAYGGGFSRSEDMRVDTTVFPPLTEAENEEKDWIQMSKIPRALERLNLECDEEILNIFRDVAEDSLDNEEEDPSVHRQDFLKVCAVLMEMQSIEVSSENSKGDGNGSEESYESEEEYIDSEGENGDEETYLPTSEIKTRSKRLNKGKGRALTLEDELPKGKGRKGKRREIIETRFKDFSPLETSIGSVITTKGVRAVAELLNENLTDEEVYIYSLFILKVVHKDRITDHGNVKIC